MPGLKRQLTVRLPPEKKLSNDEKDASLRQYKDRVRNVFQSLDRNR